MLRDLVDERRAPPTRGSERLVGRAVVGVAGRGEEGKRAGALDWRRRLVGKGC